MSVNLVIKNNEMKSVTPVFNPQDPLYVCDFGWHKTKENHTFGPAVRPYFLLHFVVKGYGVVERNGVPTLVQKGQAFLIRPGEITTYRADHFEPWEYYWISFHGSFAKELLSRITDRLFIPYQKSAIASIQTALDHQLDTPVALLNTLLSVLSALQPNRKETPRQDAISLAMHYLENYYFREFSITDLASLFGYSRAYFSTLFLKRTGENPYRYLTKIRMEHAKNFLIETEHTIEEIAYSVGFSCVGRFSELFKKYTGISPLQYRMKHS